LCDPYFAAYGIRKRILLIWVRRLMIWNSTCGQGWLLTAATAEWDVLAFFFGPPDTMTKFSIFEKTVEALYTNVVPVPKEQCSKSTQLGVSFAAGYIAGILCAIVSHPADNLVSYLNNKKGARIGQVIKSPQNQLLLLLLPLSPYHIIHLDWILGAHP